MRTSDRKDHCIDVVHEEDGENATSAGPTGKGCGISRSKEQSHTMYKSAQVIVGYDDANHCTLEPEIIRSARMVEMVLLPKAKRLHQYITVGSAQCHSEDHSTPLGRYEQKGLRVSQRSSQACRKIVPNG